MKASQQEPLIVGRVNGPHGIKGWVKIHSYTEQAEDIGNYPELLLRPSGGVWQATKFVGLKWQGKRLIGRLKGCDDRNQAEAWHGADLAIKAEQLAELGAEEFYWHQLIGLKVYSADQLLGVVTGMMETGANDVLRVSGAGCEGALDEKERLLPYLPGQVIERVDLDAGVLRVDWDPEF